MKKLSLICMSALLMLAVSCKKDKKTEVENAGSGFRATVEQHNGDSKTHLDGLAVKWDSGDAILVESSTCTTPERFTTTGTTTGTGTGATVNFDHYNPGGDNPLSESFYAPPYTGYYPADMFEGDQLTLPPTQDYVENTFASGANPMAAKSSNTLLPFKNICGVLKLQLYSTSTCKVKSISITTSDDTKPLYGTGTVTFEKEDENDDDDDVVPTLSALSNGGSTLTLIVEAADGIELYNTESTPTAFYFVVPAGTLGTSFTVKVTETDGKIWSKTANAPQNTIVRSRITVLPEQAVTTKPDIPDGALSGLFTVGMDGEKPRKVYFSQGNLQFHTTDKKWQFANNQYEVCDANTNSHTTTDYAENTNKWIDLFGWGSTGNAPTGDVNYVHYEPWSTDNTPTGHSSEYNYYGYGPSTNSSSPNLSVSNGSDWGKNIGDGKTWRTLSKEEWVYLLNTTNASSGARKDDNRFAKAMVSGVKGLLIFPDGYVLPEGYTAAGGGIGMAVVNSTSASYPSVSIPSGDPSDIWGLMESAGVVFLPAAGFRDGATVSVVGSGGYYWSSSYSGSGSAYRLYFGSGYVTPGSNDTRSLGFSVRLVSEN